MLDIATTTAKISILHDIIEFISSLPIRSNTFRHGQDKNLIKFRWTTAGCNHHLLESWNHISRQKKRHYKMSFSAFSIQRILMDEEIKFTYLKISVLVNTRVKWLLLQSIVLSEARYTSFSITLQSFTIYFGKKTNPTWNWSCKWLEKLTVRYGSYLLLLYQAFVDHIFLLSYQNNPQQDSTGLVDR